MLFDINTERLARHLNSSTTKDIVKDLVTLTSDSLESLKFSYRECIFTPFVTIYAFLSQVFNEDSSCRRAVLEVSSIRKARRQTACSSATGSFCKARKKLPVELLEILVRYLSKRLSDDCKSVWQHGRVFVVDGTGFSMPDTEANAAVFARHGVQTHNKLKKRPNQRPVVAFPIGRVLGVFCLSTGAVVDLAISTWKGKGTGELSLLQRLWYCFKESDTLLGDAAFSSFSVIASALNQGCHVVSELKKTSHHRINTKLADQIIQISKPKFADNSSISASIYDTLPDQITVRIVKVICAPAGFRPKMKFIITTHLDNKIITAQELTDLYRDRWQVELNFRSIKTVLGMDILRGKSPDMVKKEVWMHMLAYNLIRQKMAQVAIKKKQPVNSTSFRATQQAIGISRLIRSCGLVITDEDLTMALILEQVGHRPGRYEPRTVKRRPKGYKFMTESRKDAKTKLHKKSKL